MKTVVVTPGDIDGIGLEIFSKAIALSSIHQKVPIIFYCHPLQQASSFFQNLLKFGAHPIKKLILLTEPGLFYLTSNEAPPHWVVEASKFCFLNQRESILVTGPLDKNTILASGISAIGHTEILAEVTQTPKDELLMTFLGSHFNVVLLTGHIPIHSIESHFTKSNLIKKFNSFLSWVNRFSLSESFFPLACLGLNPHAGDKGLIGDLDDVVLAPTLGALGVTVAGPLVPDVAFTPTQVSKYKTYFCLYHDQGLIPFKMAHSFTGVHLTAGLPFIRLSVDHGTAKDIFNSNLANPSSMLDCLQLAYQISKNH